jgi:hypothetical protein
MLTMMRRARARVLALSLGATLVLGSCDPSVRETVLGGLAQAATGVTSTFIQAFFESLLSEDPGNDVPTTV